MNDRDHQEVLDKTRELTEQVRRSEKSLDWVLDKGFYALLGVVVVAVLIASGVRVWAINRADERAARQAPNVPAVPCNSAGTR